MAKRKRRTRPLWFPYTDNCKPSPDLRMVLVYDADRKRINYMRAWDMHNRELCTLHCTHWAVDPYPLEKAPRGDEFLPPKNVDG